MIEKQNRTVEKDAAGDAGVLDDIVDFAAGKMGAARPKAAREESDGKKSGRRE